MDSWTVRYIKEHPEALKITSGANKLIYKEKNG